ncbi:hypothetical protein [Curtobacterium sp. MCJR17_043]|uniref:hypothetical protein n=1 Tax=Curtobacterium sp. MCJR17_043 TaxID=2175660 RepID=UPI0024DF5431|nr:hypothetical protein [Curtobacterium sp. MCJR17_043]WIB36642.1 hypothetical protein DEJ15_05985 [Curtobacterium sp. MCJR17_043]
MNVDASIDVPAVPASLDTVQDTFGSWWEGLGGRRRLAAVPVRDRARRDRRQRDRAHPPVRRRSGPTVPARPRHRRRRPGRGPVRQRHAGRHRPRRGHHGGPRGRGGGRGLALAIAALDRLEHTHQGGRNVWTLVCAR